jgi:hypothetical protein
VFLIWDRSSPFRPRIGTKESCDTIKIKRPKGTVRVGAKGVVLQRLEYGCEFSNRYHQVQSVQSSLKLATSCELVLREAEAHPIELAKLRVDVKVNLSG